MAPKKTQRTQKRIKIKKFKTRHIIRLLLRTRVKEKVIKGARERIYVVFGEGESELLQTFYHK